MDNQVDNVKNYDVELLNIYFDINVVVTICYKKKDSDKWLRHDFLCDRNIMEKDYIDDEQLDNSKECSINKQDLIDMYYQLNHNIIYSKSTMVVQKIDFNSIFVIVFLWIKEDNNWKYIKLTRKRKDILFSNALIK
jgi:hypothetical protein